MRPPIAGVRNMMHKLIFLLLSVCLLCTACETESYTEFRLSNQSAHTIIVSGYDFFRSDSIRTEIPAGQEALLSNWDVRGISSEPPEPSEIFGQSLRIATDNGKEFLGDASEASAWSLQTDERRWTVSNTYTLLLSDTDF
ncbi:MAG: hypothetical protein ACO4CH_11820 [Saprospiraceae bacterium]